jgi:ABC-type nickel/cobalt efflux system permease component RcnA
MIVVMGLSLLVSRLRALGGEAEASGAHRHGLFGRAHSHFPASHAHPAHDHGQAHDHGDGSHQHDDATEHRHAEPRVGMRGLLTLGIAGGIIPCPSALVVMLAAISLGQVVFGMLLIVAFSFGLAGVLVAIGLALVLGRRLSRAKGRAAFERPVFARALAALPVVSAVGVTLAGLAITYQAWSQPGL